MIIGPNYFQFTLIARVILFAAIGLQAPPAATSSAAAGYSGHAGFGLGNSRCAVDRGHAEFIVPDESPNGTSWRLFGGGRYGANFGIEAGYIDLGKARVKEQAPGRYFETRMSGFELTPIGFLPIGRGFSACIRGGIIIWSAGLTYGLRETIDGTAGESGSSLDLALGAIFECGKYFGLRAEYSRFFIDKTEAGSGDVYTISISGLVTFGRR